MAVSVQAAASHEAMVASLRQKLAEVSAGADAAQARPTSIIPAAAARLHLAFYVCVCGTQRASTSDAYHKYSNRVFSAFLSHVLPPHLLGRGNHPRLHVIDTA